MLGLLLLSMTASEVAFSQTDTSKVEIVKTDSVKIKKPHSPLKATIMSVALPGLGQVYNGKWWKVPIIYGAFGGLIYSSVWNHQKHSLYKKAYLIRIDDDPDTVDEFEDRYTEGNLRELTNFYQRNRDLSLIFTGVIYVLNIIDATVDAHLKDFNVSDDLTLKVRPTLHQTGPDLVPAVGLTLLIR